MSCAARRAGSLATLLAALTCITAPVVAQQKVPLVLHHLIAAIDTVTWNDVVKSPFIQDQFASTQFPFGAGVDGGRLIRMFGKYNFLQLTPLSSQDNQNAVGIVLASEHAGGLELLQRQGAFATPTGAYPISADGPLSRYYYREWSDRIIPVKDDAPSRQVEFVFLQYTPAAASQQLRVDSLPVANLSNARFLTEFFDSKKLLSHLTSATLAIPVDDIAKLVRVLQRDGTTIIAEGEGAIIKLDGFTLHLIPPYRGAGVKQLQFALTRAAPANPTYRFGPRSQLRFGPGAIAVWDFEAR